MKKLLYFILFLIPQIFYAQEAGPNQTFAYLDLINAYQKLADQYDIAKFESIGKSDIGKDLHVLIISNSKDFNPSSIKKENKHILLINNGIHAGESCGIDASYLLAKEICKNPAMQSQLDNLVVLIIPIYNIGGMLNRGSFSRANQNGPEEYGFRGNAKNLDLNRDYIKCDSKNAESFTKLFHRWRPNYFIETHTTNGSDHTYTLTLIASQKDKLNPALSKYQEESLLPALYSSMKNQKKEMIPYVYTLYGDPKKGIKAFYDSPRYSSGYTSLFNCYSYITEAHVFKPYHARVSHTLAFLKSFIQEVDQQYTALDESFKEADKIQSLQWSFPVSWELDSSQITKLSFSGYTQVEEKSELTGLAIKRYLKSQPYTSEIDYFKSYKATQIVYKPDFYLVPQSYSKVIDRLKWNQVELRQLRNDSIIKVEAYFMEHFDSPNNPYEGHYLHQNMKVRKEVQKLQFYAGDYLIPTNQKNIRYIIEVLEPESDDGFFAWNFFDSNLQQKEWFSDYAFEPKAIKLLEENDSLRWDFNEKKEQDSSFAQNSFAQLYYLYKRSPYYEKSAFRLPVFRIHSRKR